jgi:2,4-diketo-3-deoxy-L-fuconate hydrolase
MRLLRCGRQGEERPAVMLPDSDHLALDISDVTPDIDAVFFEGGGLNRIVGALSNPVGPVFDIRQTRIAAPVARPSSIYAIGLNYRDHVAEAGMETPSEPLVFTKSPNSLVGPEDDIVFPRNASKLDWELELGVVIGRRASYITSPEAAADCIAGYVAANDLSERTWQLERGGQWSKGKSFATANPAGPYLVTPDEVNVEDLRLTLRLNGDVMQDGSVSSMIFGPAYIVWYLSQFLVLEPGDLIDTGTPAGIGMSKKPPRFLVPGDVLEAEIPVLGKQRNLVVEGK